MLTFVVRVRRDGTLIPGFRRSVTSAEPDVAYFRTWALRIG